jgi:hypothetical protein
MLAAELLIQPLNQSVIFFKVIDVILTKDVRRIVINLGIEPYEQIISTIKDLIKVEEQKRESLLLPSWDR